MNAVPTITERGLRSFAAEFERAYDLSALDGEALKWSAHWRRYEIPRWTSVLKLVLAGQPQRILDVGREYATYDFYLRDIMKIQVFGSDHPSVFRRLEPYWKANRFEVRPWDLMKEHCPYETLFDVVIASEVIEHVSLPASESMARLATALRPGGVLVITTPNIHRLSNILHLLEGRNILPQIPKSGEIPIWMHAREFSIREIIEAIPAARLELQRLKMSSCWERPTSSGERSVIRKALKAGWYPFSLLFPRYLGCIMMVARKPG